MKGKLKAVLAATLLIWLSLPLLASNGQKIHTVDSPLYENIRTLSLLSGTALPSASGPWSNAELMMMLEAIDETDLPFSAIPLYESSKKALGKDCSEEAFALSWDINATTELYTHSNFKNPEFQGYEGRFSYYNEYHPTLTIALEVWPAEYFYSYSEISLGNYTITSPPFGSTALSTNIFGFQDPLHPKFSDLNMTFPYRAFVSAGGNSWSLQLGRDRINWGHGITGNLFIGDNLPYHNMLRFTTFSPNFKYTFISSFFPHPKTYASREDESGNTIGWGDSGSQNDLLSGLYMLMAHRLEFRCTPKLRFSLSESIMYQAEDNTLDLQVFNPVMVFHNYYIKANANSLLGISLDYTLPGGFALYGELVVDEFALPTPNPAPGEKGNPNAFGFLLGVRGAIPINDGIMNTAFEAVLTEPDLYLRSKAGDDQKKGEYGINYIAAVRKFSEVKTIYDEEFIGYRYGGDAICFDLALSYQKIEKFAINGNLFYMMHGTYDKWTCWTTKPVNTYPLPPTTEHPMPNHVDDNASSRDAIEHSFVLSIGTETKFASKFDMRLETQLDFLAIIHPGNIKANSPIFDTQLTVMFNISFL